jgi:hypothetical protein
MRMGVFARSCARPLVAAVAALAVLLGVPVWAATDPYAAWFDAGHCAAFDGASNQQLPYVKSGQDDLVVTIRVAMQKSFPTWYVYDPKAGIAYRHTGQDSGVTKTLRLASKPPAGVPEADLRGIGTQSGLKLGASAATVVATLGKPYVVKACGLQRYEYTRVREGAPDEIDFTIRNGRVVEIFSTLDG